MHCKNQLILNVLILLSLDIKAQMISNIGNKVPDLSIAKIIHSSKRHAKLSDFKDQLLILDFWSIGCPGCIEALPKMQALQKQFIGRATVLPVSREPENIVLEFWKQNKYTKNLTLPSVVDDRELNGYFIHRSIPHEVWIYKGSVIAITEPEYVDAYNIEKVLRGEQINWPIKYDYYKFNQNKPLFNPDTTQIDTISTVMDYSAISDFKEGAVSEGFSGGPGTIRNLTKKTVRTFFLNQPIYNSYLIYWGKIIKLGALVKPSYEYDPNQIVWEVVDRNKYRYEPGNGYRQDWLRKYAICFESLHADTGQNDKQVYRSIISDMDALLGLKVRWEKRKEKVFVIVRNKAIAKPLYSTSSAKPYNIFQLVKQISQIETNPYFFDESSLNKNEIMWLDIRDFTDIEDIRKALQSYGLDLKEEERMVDKFVVTEVNNGLMIDAELQAIAQKRKKSQKGMNNPDVIYNQSFMSNNKMRHDVVELPSGLQYKVLKDGSGPKPNATSRVRVHYTGMLVNGKIFDSSFERGKPSEFAVKDVIPGWTEALQLMSVGSKWILYLPANLAYGEHTSQGTFPPNSNLIFEIELLSILP